MSSRTKCDKCMYGSTYQPTCPPTYLPAKQLAACVYLNNDNLSIVIVRFTKTTIALRVAFLVLGLIEFLLPSTLPLSSWIFPLSMDSSCWWLLLLTWSPLHDRRVEQWAISVHGNHAKLDTGEALWRRNSPPGGVGASRWACHLLWIIWLRPPVRKTVRRMAEALELVWKLWLCCYHHHHPQVFLLFVSV